MDYIFLEIAVIVALQFFWQRLSVPKVTSETEVERITVLQEVAAARRAEYAAEREQVARADAAPPDGLPSTGRRRVMEAEAAYAAALQAWENGQFRQKSP